MQDEDALMERVAAGDIRAFEMVVKTHQDLLLRVATRLLGGDHEDARDAVQESFVRLWRARTSYEGRAHLRAYLLRITRRVCVDRMRICRPTEELPENWQAAGTRPEERAEATALEWAVRQAVGELPEPQRVVFLLSHYEGFSYAEIASALDCPLGTVASRKRLATETLRRRLAPWLEQELENAHDV